MEEETKESLQVDAISKDTDNKDADADVDVDIKTSVEPDGGESINKTGSDMCDSSLKEESSMNGIESSVDILSDTKTESTDTHTLDSNSKSPELDDIALKSHNSSLDENSECVISSKESKECMNAEESSNFVESLKINCNQTSSPTDDFNSECKNSNTILTNNEHCDAVENINVKQISLECNSQDYELNKNLENQVVATNVNNESQFVNEVLSPKKEEQSTSNKVSNESSIIEEKNVISPVKLDENKILEPADEKMEVDLIIPEENACSSLNDNIVSSSTEKEVNRTSIDIEEENFKVEEDDEINLINTKGNESDQNDDEIKDSISENNKSNEFTSNNVENDDTKETEKKNVDPIEVTTSSTSENSQEIDGIKESDIKIDIVQEENNQSNLNSSASSTELEGDNMNRIESDEIEIMNTEMVNCNEIEMIELTDNEESKEKEIDRIGTDSCSDLDSKNDDKSAGVGDDMLDTNFNEKIMECNDNNKNLLMEEDSLKCENSESQTITEDASRVSAESNVDEDVCIIPDSMTPRLPTKSKVKSLSLKKKDDKVSEESDISLIDVTACESDNVQQSSQKKKKEDGCIKTRPTRNAAKLAGNKIRTLVLNDLLDGQGSGSNSKNSGGLPPNLEESHRVCVQCKEVKLWRYLMVHGDINQYLCSEECSEAFAKSCQAECESQEIASGEFNRKCAHCCSQVLQDDRWLFWETMDFCNEDCLGKYQTKLGSNCTNCKGNVFPSSLGKYCVRFGCDVKQFCSSACLEEYKKGLKVCSYCQKDMSSGVEGFLAPVGDKGQFKDFCSQTCMEKYEKMSSNAPAPEVNEECAVCSNCKPVCIEVELDNKLHKLCSEPCFAAFKFVNNITEGRCDMCKKYFDRTKAGKQTVFYDESLRVFCSKTCMNVYILANRKIVPCSWCKVKKYNFDMIRKGKSSNQVMMCSLNCLTLHDLSMSTATSKLGKCDFCQAIAPAQYHLSMSDGTTRSFCNYTCALSFQNQFTKPDVDVIPNEQLTSPIPIGVPRKVTPRRSQMESPLVPVISSVQSLASPAGTPISSAQFPISGTNASSQEDSQSVPDSSPVTAIPAPPPQIYQQIITKPPPAKVMKNKSILCKPYSHTKGVSCRPLPCMKETQTDQSLNRKFIIPIPVPIYVPCPMHMFATPFPVPVPFALPVPVPIFIPTTRNSAKGIMKEIKKIQEKIPTDPFEAELLMMAEMVAGDKKQDPTDSESEEGNEGDDGGDGTYSPNNVDANNTFGDDMLQMALKMATELEEPAVDMESVLTSNTITTQTQPPVDPNKALYGQVNTMQVNRGRKRSVRGGRNSTSGTPNKRGRRTSGSVDVPLLPPPEPVPPPRIEVEKPDADMCLKYTFGVNAWRHWVVQKNAELEKVAMTNRKIKLFKPDLLQLTADELNFSLCLFVKEVRKPNGTEYAPDTIYYLCLGIQQYLFENGRIDNIFTDSYYEKFTDCLDEVAKKFAALYSDSQYIVTRVEEEHLWESKQLGAHSPHVLLSTLMFFNTKHFNLVTVEEHMQLSFSHIMKHWKRNPNTPGVAKVPGSRNVLLRFYPPQSALEANSRKKKVYEQQENEENPLRCPVKLYEFYLSKCPESVKTRNDVFYLLPERSCVPDSPVWYSTMALGKEPLMKMLHRVKMVKEINIALLSC